MGGFDRAFEEVAGQAEEDGLIKISPERNLGWSRAKVEKPVALDRNGMLQSKGLAVVRGRRGHGKSWLALKLCIDMARSGQRVILVTLEGPENGLLRMQGMWAVENEEGRDLLDSGLYLESSPPVGSEGNRNFIEQLRGAQSGEDLARHFTGISASGQDADVVVVDNLRLLFDGVDENSNTDMALYLRPWRELAQQQGIAVMLVTHESYKPGAGGAGARGASTIEDNADTVLSVKRILEGATRRYEVEVQKRRSGRDDEAWNMYIEDGLPRIEKFDLTGQREAEVEARREKSAEENESEARQSILAALDGAGPDGMSTSAIEKAAGGNKQTHREVREQMRESGVISKTRDGRSHVWRVVA